MILGDWITCPTINQYQCPHCYTARKCTHRKQDKGRTNKVIGVKINKRVIN